MISQFTVFAGHVLMGLIIFAIGLYLANLAAHAIVGSGTQYAEVLALAAPVAILVLPGAMALWLKGLANEIINLAFRLLLGAIVVAVALTFGLDGREIAGRNLEQWQQSLRSRRGTLGLEPPLPPASTTPPPPPVP